MLNAAESKPIPTDIQPLQVPSKRRWYNCVGNDGDCTQRAEPPPFGDTNEELAALIATLHQTDQRLEKLTARKVDAAADVDGKTFLYAPPLYIAVLDTHGFMPQIVWLTLRRHSYPKRPTAARAPRSPFRPAMVAP